MAATSRTLISQWRALPVPLQMAGGLLAMLLALGIARWLGAASFLIAGCLWLAVVGGLLRANGGLPWIDRYPALARVVDIYVPRPSSGTRRSAPSRAKTPSEGTSGDSSERTQAAPDVSRFIGLDEIRQELTTLIEGRQILANTIAAAPLLLLVGPRGTGKSSVARDAAARLHQAGLAQSARVLEISEFDFPAVDDENGPLPETFENLSARLQTALDGVVLLEDLDRIARLQKGRVVTEVGLRLLRAATTYRRRIILIGTFTARADTDLDEVAATLDPGRRWLRQFDLIPVNFPSFDSSTLRQIAMELLTERGLRCASGAEAALREKASTEAADGDSENARAMEELVGRILRRQADRLRRSPTRDPREIIADDV